MGTMIWGFGLTGIKYHDIKEEKVVTKDKKFGYTVQPREAILSKKIRIRKM